MKKILIQLDSDPQPSSFDRVVALDAGADEVFSYGSVTPDQVEGLVHGGMFTRGPKDLKNTALFIGGRDVEAGQKILNRALKSYFGPIRLSAMIDCNGSNTTAAAAVLNAGRHIDLSTCKAVIFGGTGPVGQRVGELIASAGGTVRLTSRSLDRAEEVCDAIREQSLPGKVEAHETANRDGKAAALHGVNVIFAAGAAGAQFLTSSEWSQIKGLKVAIDLNAVPPAGLDGIEPQDAEKDRHDIFCYGALGVGNLKMKIHKTAIAKLFESNSHLFDVRSIYELGQQLIG